MTIELDWHEGDENPGVTWESAPEPLPNAPSPPATIARGHRAQGGAPGWVPRFLVSVLAGLVLGAVILAGVLVWRSERGNEQARQDVAIAATLVLDAWKNHDILLYSDLLDFPIRSGRAGWWRVFGQCRPLRRSRSTHSPSTARWRWQRSQK